MKYKIDIIYERLFRTKDKIFSYDETVGMLIQAGYIESFADFMDSFFSKDELIAFIVKGTTNTLQDEYNNYLQTTWQILIEQEVIIPIEE